MMMVMMLIPKVFWGIGSVFFLITGIASSSGLSRLG